LLGGFAVEALSGHRRGPLTVELAAVVAIPVAVILRRRQPLLLAAVVAGLALPMVWKPTLTGLYALLVPPYSVAAWGSRRQAAAGMILWAGAETFSGLTTRGDGSIGDIFSPIAISCVALATGFAMRNHRMRANDLERANAELANDGERRARMVVDEERARIAREIHVAIAGDVSTMILQAEVAKAMLDRDTAAVEAAIASIVATGRPALGEMRRILGVLRHSESSELGYEAVAHSQPVTGDRLMGVLPR
jgi:signal transduction histidine kinase